MWSRGTRALRKDPVIGPLIKKHGKLPTIMERNYFRSLVYGIASQQISGKAAAAIMKRIDKHYKGLTARKVAAGEESSLRKLGLSGMKANYVHVLAQHFVDGTVKPRRWRSMDDEQLIAELVKVKGIGRWTAEMFLIFTLSREDVWPVDDYGIQKALRMHFKLRNHPSREKMVKLGEQWRPYRSVASLYFWRSLDI